MPSKPMKNLKGKEAADRYIEKYFGPGSKPPVRPNDMAYREFVRLHGGKSTARLAALWRERFGPRDRVMVSRDPGGAMEPGNEAIAPAPSLPGALRPAPPDPNGSPPPAASAPAADMRSLAEAVSNFVAGRAGGGRSDGAVENPVTRPAEVPGLTPPPAPQPVTGSAPKVSAPRPQLDDDAEAVLATGRYKKAGGV